MGPAQELQASTTSDDNDFSSDEPKTLEQLEQMYDTVLTIPARCPSCQLKIVNACPRGGEAPATDIEEGQVHKLFIVST